MAISYGTPDNRELHFLREHLDFKLATLVLKRPNKETGEDSIHHIYVCEKKLGADQKMINNYSSVMKEI